jgi:hypothetical protein
MSLALGSWSTQAGDDTKAFPGRDGNADRSDSELAGDWYNWLVQFGAASNPIFESGTVDCARGQKGQIWFLAGNFGGVSHRTCTIPNGKALFFPLINILFWVPEDGATVDEVRKKANAGINPTSVLQVQIDDVAIVDPFAYRAQSPPGGFALNFGPLLSDFGFEPLPDPRKPAVADGYWILVPPLHKGEHKIHFHSANSGGFDLDVTYILTVGKDDR